MSGDDDLLAHLATGVTTTCQCWAVTRNDGQIIGFTDHDQGLSFDGIDFRAETGLAAKALEQTTGLSVNNTEVLGVLSSAAISEADIAAGRYDGAAVTGWLVNWRDVAERLTLFAGTLGEITRGETGFVAELRGMAEALNIRRGPIYQKGCAAILGDAACGVDVLAPGYSVSLPVQQVVSGGLLSFAAFGGFADAWFANGRCVVESGIAAGQVAAIKRDIAATSGREIELWEPLRGLASGDTVRLEAGCNKRPDTCRLKFANFTNYRGFPHLPGDDWMLAVPQRGNVNDGGSMNK